MTTAAVRKRREMAMEGARSTDKCLPTANNEGVGLGVRDVLTFLYIDVFPPVKGIVAPSSMFQNDKCSGKILRVSERHL